MVAPVVLPAAALAARAAAPLATKLALKTKRARAVMARQERGPSENATQLAKEIRDELAEMRTAGRFRPGKQKGPGALAAAALAALATTAKPAPRTADPVASRSRTRMQRDR